MKKLTIAIDGHSSCGKSTMAKDLARQLGYVYVDTGAMYRAVTLFALRNGLINEAESKADAADIESKVNTVDSKVNAVDSKANAVGSKVNAVDSKANTAGSKVNAVGAEPTVDVEGLRQRMGEVNIAFHFNSESGRPDTLLGGDVVESEIRSMRVSRLVSAVAALPFVREALVAQQRAMGEQGGVVMDGRDIGTVVFPHAELKVFVTASAAVRAQRRYDELRAKGQAADYDDILRNVQQRDYMDSHRETSPLRQAEDAVVLDNSQLTMAEQNAWLMEQVKRVSQQADGNE